MAGLVSSLGGFPSSGPAALEIQGEALARLATEQQRELAKALQVLESEGGLHSGQERWSRPGSTEGYLVEKVGEQAGAPKNA